MYTLPPFFRYSPAISARRCQSTTLCHSVRSCHSPLLSLKRSLVASVILATGVPLGVYLTSGSLPRLPMRITLLMLFPAMGVLLEVMGFARGATGKASPAAGRTFARSGGSNIPEGGRKKLCGMTGYSHRGKAYRRGAEKGRQ